MERNVVGGASDPATYLVRTALGVCEVRLGRRGLELGDRGGFEARWAGAEGETEALGLEAFRACVKAQLRALYEEQHGRPPGVVALNLASFQLLDDLQGWTKLNWRAESRR